MMMMARSWTQNLTRFSLSGSESAGRCMLVSCNSSPESIRSIRIRHCTYHPTAAAVDMDNDSDAAAAGGDTAEMEIEPPPPTLTSTAVWLRKFDEAIHRIMARQSAPDWLPLVPGSSYYGVFPPMQTLTSTAGLRELDEAIQRIMAMRSAPYWLPLVPGSSYWVPPPRRPPSKALFELFSNLENSLSNEAAMSLTTARGWPSSAFYLHHHHSHQGAPSHSVQLGINSENTSDSEEEGE